MKNCLSMIRRILLGSATVAVGTFAVLVLIGLWEHHALEATALGLRGIYERYSAFQAGLTNDVTAYREAAETAPLPANTTGQSAAFEE
jgi:hypothetical protein